MLMMALFVLASCATPNPQDVPQRGNGVEGLWHYTGLISSAGQSMPLTGIFLFKDGVVLQQATFNGSPFEQQGAMAHAGTYTPTAAGVNLTAEQTISISPSTTPPLSFRRDTRHVLTIERSGSDMKAVFGSGTVQTFNRAGPGDGRVYKLSNGRFAFVDGYFIIVAGDENGTVSGYGRYDRTGDRYSVQVTRWAEVVGRKTNYLRDVVLEIGFDGRTLSLPDGRRFTVAG